MKIWYGYGSEHSMNLVMIGRFKDARSAARAKGVVEELTEQVRDDEQAGETSIGDEADRYTDALLNLLRKVGVHNISPTETQQFAYDFSVKLTGDELVLTTDESDFSAFLKVFIENGARVEVYSAHDYPDTGYGR